MAPCIRRENIPQFSYNRYWISMGAYLHKLLTIRITITIKISAVNNQIVTITAAATQEDSWSTANTSSALSRHSSKTSSGMNLRAKAIPNGAMIRSSKYPRIGMKSGIKSIGLKVCATTKMIKAFAYQGTLGSFEAR